MRAKSSIYFFRNFWRRLGFLQFSAPQNVHQFAYIFPRDDQAQWLWMAVYSNSLDRFPPIKKWQNWKNPCPFPSKPRPWPAMLAKWSRHFSTLPQFPQLMYDMWRTDNRIVLTAPNSPPHTNRITPSATLYCLAKWRHMWSIFICLVFFSRCLANGF